MKPRELLPSLPGLDCALECLYSSRPKNLARFHWDAAEGSPACLGERRLCQPHLAAGLDKCGHQAPQFSGHQSKCLQRCVTEAVDGSVRCSLLQRC